MNEKRSEELNEIYEEIAAKHLTDDDRAALTRDGVPVLLQPDSVWPKLHEEAQRLMETGDHKSIEAMDLARRWMEKVFEVTGGDSDLTRKVREVARDLNDNTHFKRASPDSHAMMDFVRKAYGAAIEAGLMPKP